jgi:phosphatidate phosphatase PAH1
MTVFESKTYVVDIDGVIAEQDSLCKTCKYEASSPITKNIEAVNKLYDEGHYIKYFTARGMGTYKGNATLAGHRWEELTKCQLKMWGCKYHELIMGKPSADYYIDDKAVNSNDFFN